MIQIIGINNIGEVHIALYIKNYSEDSSIFVDIENLPEKNILEISYKVF